MSEEDVKMDCLAFRRRAGAEPGSRDAEMLRHRLACPPCAEYQSGLEAFDRVIDRAIAVPAPEGLAERIKADASMRDGFRRRWLAVAASIIAVVATAATVIQTTRGDGLDRAVMDHIYHEPHLLVSTDQRVEPARLSEVVHRGGARLNSSLSDVSYAVLCPFRGRMVPHLVIEGRSGPVTVLLLPDERVSGPEEFNESGFRGVIVPVGDGSIAIVEPEEERSESLREQLTSSVEWRI